MHHEPLEAVPPGIVLITGNMASGKSTVALALAQRLPRSVHLRGDAFRRMIVNGQAAMGLPLSAEADRQLQLRYALAADAAKRYADAGFTVIYQDIVIGPALAPRIAALQPQLVATVVLCPSAEAIAARAARGKTGYPGRSAIDAFDRVLRMQTPRLGHWLDTSELDVAATVERILDHLRTRT